MNVEKTLFLIEIEPEQESSINVEKTYDCCICKISSIATLDRPIGIISLVKKINSKYTITIILKIPLTLFNF